MTSGGKSSKLIDVLGLVCAAVLVASFAFRPDTLPRLSVCTFYNMTGLPCATCGLTRSLCSIAHGEFANAWHYHPFGFLFSSLFLAVALMPLVRRAAPSFQPRLPRAPLASAWFAGALLLFGISRWIDF